MIFGSTQSQLYALAFNKEKCQQIVENAIYAFVAYGTKTIATDASSNKLLEAGYKQINSQVPVELEYPKASKTMIPTLFLINDNQFSLTIKHQNYDFSYHLFESKYTMFPNGFYMYSLKFSPTIASQITPDHLLGVWSNLFQIVDGYAKVDATVAKSITSKVFNNDKFDGYVIAGASEDALKGKMIFICTKTNEYIFVVETEKKFTDFNDNADYSVDQMDLLTLFEKSFLTLKNEKPSEYKQTMNGGKLTDFEYEINKKDDKGKNLMVKIRGVSGSKVYLDIGRGETSEILGEGQYLELAGAANKRMTGKDSMMKCVGERSESRTYFECSAVGRII